MMPAARHRTHSGAGLELATLTDATRERLARARAMAVLGAAESERLIALARSGDQAGMYDCTACSATSASGKTKTRGAR